MIDWGSRVLHSDSDNSSWFILSILEQENLQDPLTKFVWAEQKKAFGRSMMVMRWQPTLVQLALLLHTQSPQAYYTLQGEK